MSRHRTALAALVIAGTLLAVAGCTTAPGSPATSSASVTIGVDLAFRGAAQSDSEEAWGALTFYLQEVGGRAGSHAVALTRYDNSTEATGSWDEKTCADNAAKHVAVATEVAVIGTSNTGCAKIELPVLNAAPGSPMLMVSHLLTYPGLTKSWDTGEPGVYAPSGNPSFARVVGTDDAPARVAAQFAASDLKVRRCLVLNDGETYGRGVATAFAEQARRQGVEVVGETAWSPGDNDYTALFIPAKTAAADCVFLGGTYANNGERLTKDKVAVLGGNDSVKLLVSAGFSGYPDFLALPQADGAYLAVNGLSVDALAAAGRAAEDFIDAYQGRLGRELRSSAAVYAVAALQLLLDAIEASDGTRKGVRDQVLGGSGITVSAVRCVLGHELGIDPASGDVRAGDVSILMVKDGKEATAKVLQQS